MPLAISYVRFSSKKQEEGDSLRRQRKLATDWIAKNPEYTLSDITYEDLGLSASKGHHLNGNLGKILDAVENGAIPAGSVILVETLDRFSRLPAIDTLTRLKSLLEKGVDLITLTDNIRYDTKAINSNQLFMLAGAALAAHDYAKNLGLRVAESYEGRADDAKAGKPIKRRNGFWLTSTGELKPVEAALVAEVFNKFINGVSSRELARIHSNHFANPSSVRKLLRNIAVCGHWQRYDKNRQPSELIRNAFQPAIEEVVFHQAQRMVTRQEGATNARKLPLTGLVKCSICGGNFAKRNANGKNATDTMSCMTRMLNKDKCTNSKSYPLPVLGAVFHETMTRYIAASLQQTQLSTSEKAKVLIEARIAENVAKRQRLAPFIAGGDDPVMAEQYNQLLIDHKGLTAEIEVLPTMANANNIDIRKLYKEINGDPFAVSKLLQLNGYRILCDTDSIMTVDDLKFRYDGYRRLSKTFLVTLPDGTPTNTDAMLRSNGSSDPEGFRELLPDDYPAAPDDPDAPTFTWAG